MRFKMRIFFVVSSMFFVVLAHAKGLNSEIAEVLDREGLLEKAREARLKIQVGVLPKRKVNKGAVNFSRFNTLYADSNSDGRIDEGDAGFFEPGSTVKVAIAAAVLEGFKGMEVPPEVKSDLNAMLVVSDNDSTNRLLRKLTIEKFNRRLRDLEIENIFVTRFMMEKEGIAAYPCREYGTVPGNCATADALMQVLLRIAHPEKFGEKQNFELAEEHRLWLLSTMALLPKEGGFPDRQDDECRFLQRTFDELKFELQLTSMHTKCGVAPWGNQHWTDYSLIRSAGGADMLLVVSLPGKGKTEQTIYADLNRFAKPVIRHFISNK